MLLHTPVAIEPSPLRLSHEKPVLLVGSCFTDHIGQRLRDYGFTVLTNPFGILYNPLSIAECLRRCYGGEEVGREHLVQHNGLWHSWLHHGSFSAPTAEECLSKCNTSLREAHRLLQGGHSLLVTLGTAFVYEREGLAVANCHKVPAGQFVKRQLSVEEVAAALQPYPALYTVSPIRHWADGAHGNQLSKATLLLAIDHTRHPYFPAYEIVMDELRDYRFYEPDMLHPSQVAVDIIWERFQQTYMDPSTIALGQKHHQLHLLEGHRPLHPHSTEALKHQQRINTLRNELNIR